MSSSRSVFVLGKPLGAPQGPLYDWYSMFVA
jgi:hypothetical protein